VTRIFVGPSLKSYRRKRQIDSSSVIGYRKPLLLALISLIDWTRLTRALRLEAIMLSRWSIRVVRTAIRKHRLSFPSQVPVFREVNRPELQWRIVLLYFVRGWSQFRIGQRYGMTTRRVGQLARQWIGHAIKLGYVDHISPAE
jgi:hypothetical protein